MWSLASSSSEPRRQSGYPWPIFARFCGFATAAVPHVDHVVSLLEQRRAEVAARIRELRQLERDLVELGTAGIDLDPARCDPSGICGVIALEHRASSVGRA
jgi:hypothetical protein